MVVHSQAFLQPERAINVTPDKKAATASVLVTLHNDMRCVPRRDGFSLLNHDAPAILVKDAAFHKFSEMSNIGPWIDREDKLQWEYKIDADYRGARNVRNGRSNRDALIEKEGYMINERGQVCITGFSKLGNLSKAAHIETGGYMINKRGKECITGLYDIGTLGCEATSKISAAKALDEQHTHICISVLCRRGASVHWSLGYPSYQHHCYDPQLSGIRGQKPKQKRGLKLHMCKKCHRTAKHCEGGDRCRVTCNTTNGKSCQHLH